MHCSILYEKMWRSFLRIEQKSRNSVEGNPEEKKLAE